MKQDSNHILNSNNDIKVTFEELHIRHLNLLMDLRTEKSNNCCLLYTSPSPRDRTRSRMPSSA